MVAIQSGRMPFLFGALISSRLKNRENERNEPNVCSGGSVFFTGSHLQYAVIWTVSKMMPFTFLSTSLDTPPPPTLPPLLLPSPPPFRQTKIPFFFVFIISSFSFPEVEWPASTGSFHSLLHTFISFHHVIRTYDAPRPFRLERNR